jgi:Protein of unknown function (DUF3060)
MDPDDPEARIRELEVGSFSENPGIATPPPPQPLPPRPSYGPPPSPQYGTGFDTGAPYGPPNSMPPYGGGVQRRRPRRRVSGIRRVLFAVGAVVLVAHLSRDGLLSLSRWWPHFGSNSSTSAPLTVEKGGTLSVSGNNTAQTVACNDGTLTVGGNGNEFTVTGHCLTLHVSGSDTHVTVDSADTIDGGGIRTVTTYHSGTPKIVKTGIDVTVQPG